MGVFPLSSVSDLGLLASTSVSFSFFLFFPNDFVSSPVFNHHLLLFGFASAAPVVVRGCTCLLDYGSASARVACSPPSSVGLFGTPWYRLLLLGGGGSAGGGVGLLWVAAALLFYI
ncbi:unnamed protein product [Prunus armeniaca]